MRKPRKQWSVGCAWLLIFQVCRSSKWRGPYAGVTTYFKVTANIRIQGICGASASEHHWMSTSQLTASRMWHRQHQRGWSAPSVVSSDSLGTSRLLLQAEGQSQGVTVDGMQQDASLGVESVAAAAQEVALPDTQIAEVASQSAEEPEVLQYQTGSSPSITNDKLIDAAANQASHYLSALPELPVQTHDLDAWPLVDPPFQPALHEVYGVCTCWQSCSMERCLIRHA